MRRETQWRAPDAADVVGMAVGALWSMTTSAQGPRQGLPPLVPESLVGSVSFDLYCASCHGRQGRGDGPTAASLKHQARRPDRAGAEQPRRVPARARARRSSKARRGPRATAASDMPVWGPTLRALDASDARVTVRLQNLVAFIESMQQAAAAARRLAAAGRRRGALSRLLRATATAPAGRGDGAMAGQLRRAAAGPHDLRDAQWRRVSRRAGPPGDRRHRRRGARRSRHAGVGRGVQALGAAATRRPASTPIVRFLGQGCQQRPRTSEEAVMA